ncbi:MAG: sugar transferase [Candidatus Gracilibacteria bacterium]
MKRSEIFFGLLRIPVDLLAAIAALFAAYYLRAQAGLIPTFLKEPDLSSFPDFDIYLKTALVGSFVFLILLGFFGLYSLKVSDSLVAEIRKIFLASLIWLMVAITYYFIIREFPFSRLVLFYAAAFLFVFASAGRIIIKNIQNYLLIKKGIGRRKIIFIGNGEITEELKAYFENSHSASIVAIVKNLEELELAYRSHPKIEEVIQTKDENRQAQDIIDFCRENHLQYNFVPDLLEMYRSNVEIRAIGCFPLISLRPTPLDGWGKVIKRMFDFVLSGISLIILSPFFIIIAIAIKLDSRGSVFFRFLENGEEVKRSGEHGKPFHCWKFRTMKVGTHQLRYTELADQNLRKDSPLVKIKDDPRVTFVGKFLRRFSIDELPQLWNVFTGNMSLVGPRPHLLEEVEKYKQHHKFVLTIKPGLTGLPQISGRSDLPFEEEVNLDTYYIENWSLWLDLKIVLKTIFVVLRPYKE